MNNKNNDDNDACKEPANKQESKADAECRIDSGPKQFGIDGENIEDNAIEDYFRQHQTLPRQPSSGTLSVLSSKASYIDPINQIEPIGATNGETENNYTRTTSIGSTSTVGIRLSQMKQEDSMARAKMDARSSPLRHNADDIFFEEIPDHFDNGKCARTEQGAYNDEKVAAATRMERDGRLDQNSTGLAQPKPDDTHVIEPDDTHVIVDMNGIETTTDTATPSSSIDNIAVGAFSVPGETGHVNQPSPYDSSVDALDEHQEQEAIQQRDETPIVAHVVAEENPTPIYVAMELPEDHIRAEDRIRDLEQQQQAIIREAEQQEEIRNKRQRRCCYYSFCTLVVLLLIGVLVGTLVVLLPVDETSSTPTIAVPNPKTTSPPTNIPSLKPTPQPTPQPTPEPVSYSKSIVAPNGTENFDPLKILASHRGMNQISTRSVGLACIQLPFALPTMTARYRHQ